jgi:hypothetical protein
MLLHAPTQLRCSACPTQAIRVSKGTTVARAGGGRGTVSSQAGTQIKTIIKKVRGRPALAVACTQAAAAQQAWGGAGEVAAEPLELQVAGAQAVASLVLGAFDRCRPRSTRRRLTSPPTSR